MPDHEPAITDFFKRHHNCIVVMGIMEDSVPVKPLLQSPPKASLCTVIVSVGNHQISTQAWFPDYDGYAKRPTVVAQLYNLKLLA
jgi:hypothetical protein